MVRRSPPFFRKGGCPGKGRGCGGASSCRWKMRARAPRSKNKNCGVREMSSPPGLWLVRRAVTGRGAGGRGHAAAVKLALKPVTVVERIGQCGGWANGAHRFCPCTSRSKRGLHTCLLAGQLARDPGSAARCGTSSCSGSTMGDPRSSPALPGALPGLLSRRPMARVHDGRKADEGGARRRHPDRVDRGGRDGECGLYHR